jgi:hypothetical protein
MVWRYGGDVMNQQNDKAGLMAKRDELIARLTAIESDYRRGLDADAEEQALEMENAEVLDAIAQSTAEELESVEAQLAALGK